MLSQKNEKAMDLLNSQTPFLLYWFLKTQGLTRLPSLAMSSRAPEIPLLQSLSSWGNRPSLLCSASLQDAEIDPRGPKALGKKESTPKKNWAIPIMPSVRIPPPKSLKVSRCRNATDTVAPL